MLNGLGEKMAIDFARQSGIKAGYWAADVSKPTEVRTLIADAERQLGTVGVLVDHVGIQHVAPVEEFPDEKWDAIMAINLAAAFHAIKAALRGMKRRQWGRIINMAPARGLVASAGKAAARGADQGGSYRDGE